MDPVRRLVHDHGEINRRLFDVAASLRGTALQSHETLSPDLTSALEELRDQMFLHFAREEEGLFQFVSEVAPDLESHVSEMVMAHDLICGSLARVVHLAKVPSGRDALLSIFDRFEQAYAAHARTESRVLTELDGRLDEVQRARLATLVEGL